MVQRITVLYFSPLQIGVSLNETVTPNDLLDLLWVFGCSRDNVVSCTTCCLPWCVRQDVTPESIVNLSSVMVKILISHFFTVVYNYMCKVFIVSAFLMET